MKTEIKEETEKQSSFGKAFLSKKRFVPAILIAFVLMVSIMAVPAMAARGVPQEPGSRLTSTLGMEEILWEYFVADSYPTAIRLPNGNTLFDDYGNNRVIEVTLDKDIVWECNATTTGLLAPWIAFRLSNGNTLIPDTGNDRVIEVASDCTIVWECNVTTTGLNDPEWAQRLPNGNTLIADYDNDRVIEVEPDCTIVWECNATTTGLSGPDSVERLSNGNTLIAEWGNDRVIEVEPDCTIVWECNATTTGLSSPTSAQRLPNGNTLISECGNNRAIEVASDCTIVWEVNASTHGIACPYNAQRLPNGNTMIGDTDNCRAIEVGYPLWKEINAKLDSLKGNVSAAIMPSIIQRRLIDKLEYAKALKDNAKIECAAGNFDGATKKLGVAKSQVESFASMVKITRRISSADKASFLADSTEIKGKIQTLIEYIETEHKC